MDEKTMRLLLKTISYGIIHILVAITIAYLMTGSLVIALGIGVIEPVVQTFVFAAHDFLWEGKKSFRGKLMGYVRLYK